MASSKRQRQQSEPAPAPVPLCAAPTFDDAKDAGTATDLGLAGGILQTGDYHLRVRAASGGALVAVKRAPFAALREPPFPPFPRESKFNLPRLPRSSSSRT